MSEPHVAISEEVRKLAERLTFLACFDDCSEKQYEKLLISLETGDWAKVKHHGDCTHQAYTCNRCLFESVQKDAARVARLLADALQAERERVLETVIRACDSEGYIHHSEISAFAHGEQPK